MNNPRWNQDSVQGFNDGTESGSTSKAAVNTTWDQPVDATFLVRFLIQETNAADVSNVSIDLKLQHNYNGTGFIDTTTSSSYAKIVNSTNLTHGDDTTQRIGSGTWVGDNNWVADTSGTTNTSSASEAFSSNPAEGEDEAETLHAVQIVGADVTDNLNIQFRIVEADGTILFSYQAASQVDISIDKPSAGNVFFENKNAIEHGMKPQTASGMGGVIIE
jgi:hypothetical protein